MGSAKKSQRALQLALPRLLLQSTLQTQMVRDYGTGYEGDTMLEIRVKVVPKLRGVRSIAWHFMVFFFFFCCTAQHVGSYFPHEGLN